MLLNNIISRTGYRRGPSGAVLAAMLLCPLLPSGAMAQQLGISGGYETGMWLAREDIVAGSNAEAGNSRVSGTREGRRFGMELFLPKLLFSGDRSLFGAFGLQIGASFGTSAGVRRRMLPDVPALIADADTLIAVNQSVRSDIEYRTASLRFDLMGRFNIWGPIMLDGGIWGEHRTSGTFTRYWRLLEPANVRFINEEGLPSLEEGRVLVQDENASFTSPRFSWGGATGLSCDIPLATNFILHSSLRVMMHPDGADSADSWHSLALGANLGLRFDFNPAPELTELPAPPSTPPEHSPLRASIDLYSAGVDGQRLQTLQVRQQETVTRQHLPFLPFFFFDRGDDDLPMRYAALRPGDETFAEDSLAGRDVRWLHYQGLNLLGLRMRQQPDEKIDLVGLIAPGEAAGLGLRRAGRVRKYLRDVWKIAEPRVTVAERSGHEAMVVVEGASDAIAAPVVSERRVAGLEAPQLGLRPAMDGGAGLRSWEISVRLGDRRIASYSSEHPESDEMIDMGMVLDGLDGNGGRPELSAELTVVDSAGAIAVSRDTLPVEIAPGEWRRRRSIHLLVVPEEGMDGPSPEVLQRIVSEVRAGSRITVRYAASGHKAIETELYAEKVALLLDVALISRGFDDIKSAEVLAETLPAVDAPEERPVASTVTVEVEREE